MDMTPAALLASMWQICDKPERMRCFHTLITQKGVVLDAKTFWENFWNIWTSSENLNEDADQIADLIAAGKLLGSPWVGLDDDERAALASMPDMITVYRGCVDWNQDGWSWTTDVTKAKWFAKRAFCEDDEEHFVLTAQAPKSAVVGYLTGRDESEVVIATDDLTDIAIEESFYLEPGEGGTRHSIFYAVQSGKFNNPELDKARATMLAATANQPFGPLLESIEQRLEFLNWVGIAGQQGYYKALKEALLEREKNPEAEQPFTFNL